MKEKIIGYTTGVFDLFHIGHLNLLRRAKEQCDYLIVGVSTDELVEMYKHHLPTTSFEERSSVVESIRYVDKVVAQTSLSKMEAWTNLHFDVLFHGDDWKDTPIYPEIERELAAVQCRVVFLPHTDGISSSILRTKLGERTKEYDSE